MKVGLLITSISNFGQKGFYNVQEIGLAKELNKIVDEVIVYKLIPANQEAKSEKIAGSRAAVLQMIPAKSIGINGLFDVRILNTGLDALIYFSDTQIMVPKVAKWAKKNGVPLYPYIGVTESHSTNPAVKRLIDLLFKRNIAAYKKLHCFVKTPDVEKRLRACGVDSVTVAPVGLDSELLHSGYEQISQNALKEKYGYKDNEKVLLFIGRFTQEKQPERMIDIFKEVYEKDDEYRLLMVGTGELRGSVENKVKELGLEAEVRFVDRIPNSEIWEPYRLAEAFVNLNQQEIFGMAILEAMYYGCKVAAWHAPGPDYIIEDGVSGYLVDSTEEMVETIREGSQLDRSEIVKRIKDHFMWDGTAEIMGKWIDAGS